MDCGPTCLKMISRSYGKYYSNETLRQYCNISKLGVSFQGLINAAEKIGLHALPVTLNFEQLKEEVKEIL